MLRVTRQQVSTWLPTQLVLAALILGVNVVAAQRQPVPTVTEYLQRGAASYENTNFTAAIAQYTRALTLLAQQPRASTIVIPATLQPYLSYSAEQNSKVSTNAVAFYLRGRAWQKLNEFALAQADLEQAIELAPQFVEAFMAHADLLRAQNLPDQAIADLNTVIALAPKYAEAYRVRGQLWTFMNEQNRASLDFARAEQFTATSTNAKRAELVSRKH